MQQILSHKKTIMQHLFENKALLVLLITMGVAVIAATSMFVNREALAEESNTPLPNLVCHPNGWVNNVQSTGEQISYDAPPQPYMSGYKFNSTFGESETTSNIYCINGWNYEPWKYVYSFSLKDGFTESDLEGSIAETVFGKTTNLSMSCKYNTSVQTKEYKREDTEGYLLPRLVDLYFVTPHSFDYDVRIGGVYKGDPSEQVDPIYPGVSFDLCYGINENNMSIELGEEYIEERSPGFMEARNKLIISTGETGKSCEFTTGTTANVMYLKDVTISNPETNEVIAVVKPGEKVANLSEIEGKTIHVNFQEIPYTEVEVVIDGVEGGSIETDSEPQLNLADGATFSIIGEADATEDQPAGTLLINDAHPENAIHSYVPVPDEGKEFDYWTITDEDGDSLEVKELEPTPFSANNQFTFSVTFADKQIDPDNPDNPGTNVEATSAQTGDVLGIFGALAFMIMFGIGFSVFRKQQ